MEETTKKAKAPAKPRKTASKKTTTPTNLTEMPTPTPTADAVEAAAPVSPVNGAVHSNLLTMKPSFDQVAQLAHKYWADRGYQHGHHVDDWLRAEQELRGKAS
jgi:hypothetical protein